MNPNFASVGQAFVQAYYQTFDTNRASLAPLYVRFYLCYLEPASLVLHCVVDIQDFRRVVTIFMLSFQCLASF